MGESSTGPAGFVHGIPPRAVRLQDLGAVHQAQATVRHQVRLRLAPPAQRRSPHLRPPHVEDLLTCLDHAAVGVAHHDRRHLTGRDGNHGLVEQPYAFSDLAQVDQRPALTVTGERQQIQVSEAVAGLRGLAEGGVRARGVPLEDGLQRGQVQHIAPLHAIVPAVVEETPGPGDPAAGAGQVAAFRSLKASQNAHRTARAPSRALAICPCPDIVTVGLPADEVRGHGEPLEILELQRRLTVRGQELRAGIGPCLPPKRPSPSIERIVGGSSALSTQVPVLRDDASRPPSHGCCGNRQRCQGHGERSVCPGQDQHRPYRRPCHSFAIAEGSESRSFRAGFGSWQAAAAPPIRAPPARNWRASVFSKSGPGVGWACRTGRAIPDRLARSSGTSSTFSGARLAGWGRRSR